MSRSYRKEASASVNYSLAKREANKKVRKTKDVISGRFYRKIYDSYEIKEYTPISFTREGIERWLEFSPKYKLYMK